eukprot:TRINITY_DN4420_c0_g1::TRINITY_DN4420_c0_g1_i1::g.7312::m.7312 TRINITY_DN4420_c0_g1::TRINITY_DN4420_c0_g1_i1::g.7312  ORF type:complete len:224 (+),score=18.74,EF-hand_1/PF00036.27/0.063,EF-hand_1/PF00036.27/1e+02,EF-hand_1/PF00036.27/5.9e+02,EF-hand_6/PF13405.1/0.13,EF-hand_6/PF13405.1/1.8e+03,EF-hand_7/PF13499.1/0.023 TRINITY_DN4420_c0_g1_i1:143-814(+)
MGNAASISSVISYIDSEFERLRADKTRDYLILDEVLRIQSPKEYDIDFSHIGTLFVLDKQHSGKITRQDLRDFVSKCSTRRRMINPHEFRQYMQGYCTIQMWNVVCKESGRDVFADWISNLYRYNAPILTFEEYPGTEFVGRETIETLHDVFGIERTYGIDFQQFFDLLQRAGEECDLLDLEEEQLDDAVPIPVLRQFAADFIVGFVELMGKELGFGPDIRID